MGGIARRIDIYQNAWAPRGRYIGYRGEQPCVRPFRAFLLGLQGRWRCCDGRGTLLVETANDPIGAVCRRATAASLERRRSPAAIGPENVMPRRSANCERGVQST